MAERIAGLGRQCRQAWEEGQAWDPPPSYRDVESVLIVGMGGSAIGGELLGDLATWEGALPVTVCRDYSLPPGVGPGTLVVACSYSGNTEETLSAYHEARQRGARVMAVTGGGALTSLAREHGAPLLPVGYRGEPRSALGYSFFLPLAVLCRLGLLKDKSAHVQEAVGLMERLATALVPTVPEAENLAKDMALALQGRLVTVYGAGFLLGVGRRWKTQINENAKAWALFEVLPEANHNAAAGYGLPPWVRQQVHAVFLHSRFLPARVSRRYAVTQELLARKGVPARQVDGVGDTPLAHMLTTLLLGDFTSYYLAMLNRVDPSPVPEIDLLKERLAEG